MASAAIAGESWFCNTSHLEISGKILPKLPQWGNEIPHLILILLARG
jgi:hypothetical protein